MRLKLVVFPAPLGPMSATVSPSFTENERSWTARRPPNRLLSPRITSASAIQGNPLPERAPRAGRRRTRGADDAHIGLRDRPEESGGPPEDDRDQDNRVQGQLDARVGAAAEPALEQRGGRLEQRRAEDRPPQGADPAHDGDQRRFH